MFVMGHCGYVALISAQISSSFDFVLNMLTGQKRGACYKVLKREIIGLSFENSCFDTICWPADKTRVDIC